MRLSVGTGQGAPMATPRQKCWMCAAPSIEWQGIPICQPCLDAEQISAQNQPAKAVTIGTPDGAELYLQHCALCAIEGRTNELGLASIARPADATLH